jgi:hypothetical protein
VWYPGPFSRAVGKSLLQKLGLQELSIFYSGCTLPKGGALTGLMGYLRRDSHTDAGALPGISPHSFRNRCKLFKVQQSGTAGTDQIFLREIS